LNPRPLNQRQEQSVDSHGGATPLSWQFTMEAGISVKQKNHHFEEASGASDSAGSLENEYNTIPDIVSCSQK